MTENKIRAEASSMTLNKACTELWTVLGVMPNHSGIPTQDFQAIKEIIDVRMQAMKMSAERVKKAGLHPLFPRLKPQVCGRRS
jgi:hypothetical protein